MISNDCQKRKEAQRTMTFPTRTTIGRIVCRLQALREVAAVKWHHPLPFSLLVQSTGLPLLTLQRLVHDSAKLYDVATLSRLCWFFDTSPGELLIYTTAQHLPPATPAMVRRVTLPPPQEATSWQLQLNLSDVVADHWHELRAIGAPAATLSTLKNRKTGLKRVQRQTLAYLCAVGVAIEDIFIKM